MLAYEDPTQSPSAWLLHQDERDACAAAVNGAIMQRQGRQANSAVECLYSQLEAVYRELRALGAVAPQLVPIRAVLECGLQADGLPATEADSSDAMQE